MVIDQADATTVSVPISPLTSEDSVISSPVVPVPIMVGLILLVGLVGAVITGTAEAVLSDTMLNCVATMLPLVSESCATSAATLTVIVPSDDGATSTVYVVPEPSKLDTTPPVPTTSLRASPVTGLPNTISTIIGLALVGLASDDEMVVIGPVASDTMLN